MTPILLVPGWTNSGPQHWQSLWAAEHPEWTRVLQRDWDRPVRSEWVAALDSAVASLDAPPVLIGHSLGATTIAIWASEAGRASAAGAILVAPADVARGDAPPEIRGFAPVPLVRMPFPSLLVASRNDPYLAWSRAELFARTWGAELHDAGFSGHINTDTGYGPWPDGLSLVREFLANLGA